jgi:hypothetical protein
MSATQTEPVQSTKVYFSKTLLTNGIMIGGKQPPWEVLDGNKGVIALDSIADAALITGLNSFVDQQSGGVLPINAQQYEDLKKNHPWKESAAKSWLNEPLKVAGRKEFRPPAPKPSQAAAAAVANPEIPPDETNGVPQRPPDQPDFKSGGFKPATARVPDKAAK